MSLKETLSTYWLHLQEELLPWLNDTTCGPLNEHHKQLVTVLGLVRIEAFLPGWPGLPLLDMPLPYQKVIQSTKDIQSTRRMHMASGVYGSISRVSGRFATAGLVLAVLEVTSLAAAAPGRQRGSTSSAFHLFQSAARSLNLSGFCAARFFFSPMSCARL